MNHAQILQLDPLIHAPIRLGILSILVAVESAPFSYLKDRLDTSDGNLSTHLTKLEQAGYVSIEKSFQGKRPLTTCFMTEMGRKAFETYLEQLERIVKTTKSGE
ncbi:helix-turn-helix domain-containing protein [candidate division KSB1 bacterium]|nr:helix-turn-helix domain-containing protein [candidate division KSB1 bacterium]